jgi:hypothetical protein
MGTQMNNQTDKHIDTKSGSWGIDCQSHRQTDSEADEQIGTQMNRQTDKQTDK